MFSRGSALATGSIGLAVLLAWAFSYVPGAPQLGPDAMNPVAAVLFVLAGVGLWRLIDSSACSKAGINLDPSVLVCAIAILAVSAIKTAEFATGSGPHIDLFLFASKVRGIAPSEFNILAANTVANFLLCGAALLFMDASWKGLYPAQWLILAAGIVSLLALVGYSYAVMALYQVGKGAPMAWLTAVAFLILCAGLMTARPNQGIMHMIQSPTTGGAMARRLLPMAILVPWGLGLLRWAGECLGWYTTELGIALFTVAMMFAFSALVWWNAILLHRADLRRRQAEDSLRHTSANLERSNTDLQQFAYVASHDLVEPLRMVTSYLQLLDQLYKDRLDSRAREFIGYAIDGARRMRNLIDDLLAYSRVDAKGRSFEEVDCKSAIKAAISNLKVAIEESQAKIHVGDLPKLDGDSVQVTQLFQNLIGNAIKFRGDQPPVIDISASRDNKEWIFSVADNGIGIKPEHSDRIFVIFQRLHTRREYPGTGIGLAICKKIVERHGGRIWVESTPQKGSTFKFTLPAK